MGIEDKIDFGKLKIETGEIIGDALSDLADDAQNDLKEFGKGIASDMLAIAKLDPDEREAAMEEVIAQARAIGELNRIRAVNESWEAASKIMRVIGKTAIAALTSLLMLFLMFAPMGCAGAKKGYIHVSSVRPLANKILDRHDKYVDKDKSLSTADKLRYLRSTAIIRKVMDEASK